MTWIAALRILIPAIPALLDALKELAGWLKDNFGDNPAKAIVDHAETIRKLREAKTAAEKIEASRALADLIRKL